MGEWLCWIVRCDLDHGHASGKRLREEFPEDVIAAHETAKNGDPRLGRWSLGIHGDRVSRRSRGSCAIEASIAFMFAFEFKRATNCRS